VGSNHNLNSGSQHAMREGMLIGITPYHHYNMQLLENGKNPTASQHKLSSEKISVKHRGGF
jgi:hypothetical protein